MKGRTNYGGVWREFKKDKRRKRINTADAGRSSFCDKAGSIQMGGGSRYPDLMTAKKIAQFLEISLDELVSDRDVVLYVEKNAILESFLSKGIQTAIISCAFLCYFISSIWNMNEWGNLFRANSPLEILLGLVDPMKELVLTIVLAYGVWASIRDSLNPRLAAYLCMCFFGAAFATTVISAVHSSQVHIGYSRYDVVLLAFLNLATGYITVRYFYNSRLKSPIPVYAAAGIYGALSIVFFVLGVRATRNETYSLYYFTQGIVGCLSGVLLLALVCYLAHELYWKRKRAAV